MVRYKLLKFFNLFFWMFILSGFYNGKAPLYAESFFNPGASQIQEGIESFQNQDYRRSLQIFEKAEEEFENDPRLDFNKGTTIAKSGEFLKSIPYFEKALESTDSNLRSKSYFNMAKAYENAQNTKKAIESYRKAIQENPNNLDARKNLELAYNPKMNKKQGGGSTKKEEDSSQKNSSNPFSPNEKKMKDPQDQQNQNNKSTDQSQQQQNPNSLTQEEAERLMESLNADKIQRKNSKSITTFRRDKFW